MTSLLLRGGTVVTSLDPPAVEAADVLVEGGHVVAVDDRSGRPHGRPVSSQSIDASRCLVIPGNVCAHTHLYSTLARGMPYRLAPPTDFLQILQRVWWRLDRALDEDSVRASALVGGMEALLSGTTTLLDHHASPNAIDGSLDIVAEALASMGIRSVCCYEVSDRDGPERARAGIEENRRFLGRIAEGAHPLVRGTVGAHASFTMSDATLAACAELASEFGVGIHIHAAEDALDERAAELHHAVRVVQRLADAGALDERTLLAHGVHVDDDEARLVRTSRATIAHNPRSNMNNGVGRAPLSILGDRVALGTDGIGADMFAESQAAWFRLRDDGASPPLQWPLARLAVGAGWAGRAFSEPRLGRIEPGAPADIVILDDATPTPLQPASLPGHWVYGLGARHVRDVIVAGELVVRDRRLTLVDQDALIAEARVQAAGLWQRLETIEAHPFEPLEV